MKRNVKNGIYNASNGKSYKVQDLIKTLINLASKTYDAKTRKKYAQAAIGWANYLKPSENKSKILGTLFKMFNQMNRKNSNDLLKLERYEKIKKLINDNGGRFVTVQFVKKDGSIRRMQVQPAAIKFKVKGDAASETAKKATATRKANNPNLFAVYDVQKKVIRSINLDTIQEIAMKGEIIDFRQPSAS